MKLKIKNISITLFAVLIVVFALAVVVKKDETGTKWSVRMARSEIKRSPEAWMLDFSKKLKWNYCHGLVGKAFIELSDAYHMDEFYNYIKQYADTMIYEDGKIYGYKPFEYNIDRLNTGKILFRMAEKETSPKYKLALEQLRGQIDGHPRTSEGGFWHKKVYPCQMWLDGLYMGAPFYAQYSQFVGDTAAFADVINQFLLVKKYLYDANTGLYKHGWDECKEQEWADSITGQSPEVWGRAVGWYMMALVDVLDYIPENYTHRDELVTIFSELSHSILKYQHKEYGVWYQVVDKGDVDGNYLESSCSTMYVYSMLKGIRKGYLKPSYLEAAKKGYNGILKQFIHEKEDGTISISNGCAVAGLGGKPYRDGTYEYYINEPKRDNDPKAVGPFILASLEMEQL